MPFILARKLKMSQLWKNDRVVPVTVLCVESNKISLIRSKDKDGYEAVQVSIGKKKKEFRNKGSADFNAGEFEVGKELTAEIFKEGDIVRVSGISKGKGFQGVVKRHGFHGGPKTHGQKNRLRAPGSIGSTAPQRVFPGRRMAGHMGVERVTIKGLEVIEVDKEKNLIFLKGAVPGTRGGVVEIQKIRSTKS